MGDRLGDNAPRRKRVDGTERAGIGEGREGVVRLGACGRVLDMRSGRGLGVGWFTGKLVKLLVSVLLGNQMVSYQGSHAKTKDQRPNNGTGPSRETYPVLLEAILGAEEAALNTQAQALGTLEGAGIVFAVGTNALLRGGLFGHGGGGGGGGRLKCHSL